MKIKILGNNFIRDTKFSILKIGKYVIKIPCSFAALREAKVETENTQKARKDLFFSLFLPRHKYFFGIKATPYLNLFIDAPNWRNLIEDYFSAAFKDSELWEKKELKKLIDLKYFFKFIKDYIPDSHDWWNDYLEKTNVVSSSSHGDFHADNILVKNNKLFFIDWIRYRKISSRYFDLIDFYIFYKKKEKESWMEIWQNKVDLRNIFGISIDKNNWKSYGIYKTAEELKTIYLRGDLKYKRKKYINFINNLKNKLSQNE